jgi:hypothetical protein
VALHQFSFGEPGAVPIAGDWYGDGKDSIGVYIPMSGTFFFRDATSTGAGTATASFGASNMIPVAGRWRA